MVTMLQRLQRLKCCKGYNVSKPIKSIETSCCYIYPPKKLGLISLSISHDAPSSIKAVKTLVSIFFHVVKFCSLATQVTIISPAAITTKNENISMAVTNILLSHIMRNGNAFSWLTLLLLGSFGSYTLFWDVISIQSPIKGTIVFSCIPQQAMLGLHLHLQVSVSLVYHCFEQGVSVHTQVPSLEIIWSGEQERQHLEVVTAQLTIEYPDNK